MYPDLILYNARIYTMNPAQPWAEALACRQGLILAVGTNEEITSLAGPQTQRIEAGGRLVLPGLIDAHVHFLQYAVRRHQVNLFGLADFEEVRRRLREAAGQAKPGEWVQGWGWDENLWNIQPTAALLDEIAPEVPVVLVRLDMHTWWVNSAAMQQVGLNRETPDPPESQIERDASGAPSGLLREWNAIQLVEPHLPSPDSETLLAWLQEAIGEAHRLGLTGLHDQRVERDGAESFRLFQALNRQGALKLRVHMHLAADFLSEAVTLGLQPGFGDDRLWIGHLKAFADGTMGSQTASMLEPFEGSITNYGLVVTSPDELWDLAVQADQAGFPLSVHAIGDRAARNVINVLSEFQPDVAGGRLPHRIEHVQLIHPADLPRLSQHGIFASMQPVHLLADWRTADKVWGQRARNAYAFRSLLAQGTLLAFGSDAPVAPLNPLLGIYAALTRQDEQGQPATGWYSSESLDLAEIIQAYTVGPAQLAGKSRWQGSLAPGKWADLVIFNGNLFEIEPAEIAETKVDLTLFAGEVVFSRL